MIKRVFIVHCWSGNPESYWYPWLKKELEINGFKVNVLSMPNADEPKIRTWVNFLKKNVKNPDENTYFVGHSIGCQAILRYLETLEDNIKVNKCIFVAGWFSLMGLGKDEEKIAKPWITKKINFEKIKSKAKKFIAIFSDDDPYVPLLDTKKFEKELDAEVIIEHSKGHFDSETESKELPIILEILLTK